MELVINITEEDYNNIDLFKALKIIKNGKPLDDVLGKIRSEIFHLHDWAFDRDEVLKIIDKYRQGK